MQKNHLLEEFNKLEQKRARLFEQLSKIDDEKLNEKPVGGGWSINQVVYHVYLAEQLSTGYMKKKTSDISALKPVGFGHKVRTRLLQLLLWSPIRFKAPPMVSSDKLPESLALEDVKKQWDALRNDLQHFIQEFPSDKADLLVLRHTITGMMTLRQALGFFEAHFDRHVRQIERTRREISQ